MPASNSEEVIFERHRGKQGGLWEHRLCSDTDMWTALNAPAKRELLWRMTKLRWKQQKQLEQQAKPKPKAKVKKEAAPKQPKPKAHEKKGAKPKQRKAAPKKTII